MNHQSIPEVCSARHTKEFYRLAEQIFQPSMVVSTHGLPMYPQLFVQEIFWSHRHHLCTTTLSAQRWAPRHRDKSLQTPSALWWMVCLPGNDGVLLCNLALLLSFSWSLQILVCNRRSYWLSHIEDTLQEQWQALLYFLLAGLYPVPATQQFLLSSPHFAQISLTNLILKTTTIIWSKNFSGNLANGIGGNVLIQVSQSISHLTTRIDSCRPECDCQQASIQIKLLPGLGCLHNWRNH